MGLEAWTNKLITSCELQSEPRISLISESLKGRMDLKCPIYPSNLIITPAATADPITPATFGPMACISK